MKSFITPGLIDLRAFTMLGVNSKPFSSSPIGYFGTGLKYAIAVLARAGASVTISRGLEVYSIETRHEMFRENAITSIYLASVHSPHIPLPFTTDLGKNWTLEHAYRELASNTLDEGGGIEHALPRAMAPEPNHTIISVDLDAFDSIQHSDVFLTTEPLWTSPLFEVHRKAKAEIYYRGIAVAKHVASKPSAFSYNLLVKTILTEDRTLANSYMIPWNLAGISGAPQWILETIFESEGFEQNIEFNLTDAFKDLLRRHYESGKRLPDKLFLLAKKIFSPTLRTIENADATQSLYKHVTLLKSIGINVTCPIQIFPESEAPGTLGLYAGGTIYLSEKLFLEFGDVKILSTLIEEHLHSLDIEDYSREFQDFTLDRLAFLLLKGK